MKEQFTIGTRGSELALWQAKWVQSALMKHIPSLSVSLEIIKTKGDKILDVPLAKVGGKGLFVKEIEEALLNGRIDLAVHSMKDMPAEIPHGLRIGAVPDRETPNDVLISKNNLPLKKLPRGAKIGTSSLRRSSQLLSLRPDITIKSLRGNLGTRLAKLQSEDLDAIVLAAAGVKRLNLANRVSEYIDTDILIPAVGQGALCIEIRDNDPQTLEILSKIHHLPTNRVITAERAFLRRLEGGCQVPMAAYATINGSELNIVGMVAEIDGSNIIKHIMTAPVEQAEQIGTALAETLIDRGAGKILDTLSGN